MAVSNGVPATVCSDGLHSQILDMKEEDGVDEERDKDDTEGGKSASK